MTTIYVMRHGTVHNPRRVVYGHLPGFGLSDLGRRQIELAVAPLRSAGITEIHHSPLRRAEESAEVAATVLGIDTLTSDPRLRESDVATYFQGAPMRHLRWHRPVYVVSRIRRGLLPRDETLAVLSRRVLGVIDELVRRDVGAALVIGHATPIQAAWVMLDGRRSTERELQRRQMSKASMLVLTFGDDGLDSVEYVPPPVLDPLAEG